MKKNVGTLDMGIRLVFAAVLFYIGFAENPIVSAGMSKNIIKVAAFLPLFTGLARYCPLYTVIGLSTMGACGCTNEDRE